MSTTLQSKIEALCQNFAAELQALWASAARQAIAGIGAIDATGRLPSIPRGVGMAFGEFLVPETKHAPVKGQKRDPGEITALKEKFVAYIRKNPNLRIEQINKGMGTKTRDLRLPIVHALAEGSILSIGEKRSTTYRAKR